MNWSEILVGAVIGAIFGALLQYLTSVGMIFARSRRAEWHGRWYEILPEFQGLPERWDVVEIRQDGNRLTGRAWRIHPLQERARVWKFEGYVTGPRMIGFFYLLDQKIDPASYVPVVMARDINSRHEAVWRGFYLRPEFLSPENIFDGQFPTAEMWWQRSHPAERLERRVSLRRHETLP